MEDDEEFISRLSSESGSQSPPPNGRITVTIAGPPLDRGVTLALPIQQPRHLGGGGGGNSKESEGILGGDGGGGVIDGGGGDGGIVADGAVGNEGGGEGGGNVGGSGGGGSGGIGGGSRGEIGGEFVSGAGGGGGGIGGGGVSGGGDDGGGGSGVGKGGVVSSVSRGSIGGGGIGGDAWRGIGKKFVGGAGDGGGRIIGGGAGGSGGGGGREDCWSEGATEVLIEAWGERFLELKRGNLKQNNWKEVADIVSSREDYSKTPKTDNQCKNRIDTVKKKYKTEKQRIELSGGCSSWRFFDRIEELIGPNVKTTPTASVFATGYEGENVPMGIPVGVRQTQELPQFRQAERFQPPPQQPKFMQQTSNLKGRLKRDHVVAGTGWFPPERYGRKHHKMERELSNKGVNRNGKSNWGNTVMELSTTIMKLGEAYQHAESMKLQQLVEMEKHRMNFAKELELQRMQFMTQTQMEISRMKRKLKQQQSHRTQ